MKGYPFVVFGLPCTEGPQSIDAGADGIHGEYRGIAGSPTKILWEDPTLRWNKC